MICCQFRWVESSAGVVGGVLLSWNVLPLARLRAFRDLGNSIFDDRLKAKSKFRFPQIPILFHPVRTMASESDIRNISYSGGRSVCVHRQILSTETSGNDPINPDPSSEADLSCIALVLCLSFQCVTAVSRTAEVGPDVLRPIYKLPLVRGSIVLTSW